MAHWLSDITRLFTCETTDYAELAKVVGYDDPVSFYAGTLSKSEMKSLLDVSAQEQKEDLPFEISGSLGPALAFVPKSMSHLKIVECKVRIFSDKYALQEAFFNGDLHSGLCAMVRVADNHALKSDQLMLITPAMEILARRGGPVLLILDGVAIDLKTPVPVVANFAFREKLSSMDGLKDGDIVRFDVRARTLHVESRAHDVAASTRLFLDDERHSLSHHFENSSARLAIGIVEGWCSKIARQVARRGKERPKRNDPYFRLLLNNIELIRSLSLDPEVRTSFDHDIQVSLYKLAQHLSVCAEAARLARSFTLTETVLGACIDVLEICPEVELTPPLIIAAYDALGQLHIQRRKSNRAITALTEARYRAERLSSESLEPRVIRNIQRYQRLASQFRLKGDAERAHECLNAAEKAFQMHRAIFRPTFGLIAQRVMVEDERITLALDRHDYPEAIKKSRAKMKLLEEVRWFSTSRTPTASSAKYCSKAYRRHEKLLKHEGFFREALVAHLASSLLHLDRHGPTLTNTNHLQEVHDALSDVRMASEDCASKEEGAAEINDELRSIYDEYDFESGSPEAIWATLRAVRWRMAQVLPGVVNYFGERDRLFDEPISRG
ncbi:hypothetical protein [Rhizobium leguminosarum]|uniref:hypothetical protein n=1 Tax=Rhizobium leguminosarum TaxID=384 RepID=UPI0024B37C29|nr:hypothetical protein [Rhizobium leguminosarum]WHO84161.1 hypothetical protein QMO81_007109 [Rhizobium leguminosarum]